MTDLIIAGAGGCGREIVNWIDDINNIEQTWNILGFIDDNPEALNGFSCRYRIIGNIKDHYPDGNAVYAMGIAAPYYKKKVSGIIMGRGGEFVSIIHPATRIYSEQEHGIGLITYPNAKIATGCKVGDFVTLQSTILGHDAEVGDFATISSSCGITGGVKIGEGAFLADHACISVGLEIGHDSYVGLGSVVIRDVEPLTKVFGNPARVYDRN